MARAPLGNIMRPAGEQANGDEGFTLVEAVIATMILAIGLGATALTFNMAMRSVATNRSEMGAMHAARDALEELRTLPWNHAALGAGTYPLSVGGFTGTYTVTAAGTDLRDVTVSMNWPNAMQQGSTAAMVLTTTFAKPLHN